MKIYANVAVDFRKTSVTPTTMIIGFNWITETGICAGNISKSITVPSVVTVDAMNNAIKDAIKTAINGSGLYTLQRGDAIVLFGGVTNVDRVITLPQQASNS